MSLRVSTSLVFRAGSEQISRQQAGIARTQEQMSSGLRVLAPSDDPIAAAQALRTAEALSLSTQFESNQGAARDVLTLAESLLGSAGDTLLDARTLLVSAGNGALSDADRGSLAIALDNALDRLMGIANARDANGSFLFSGYQGDTQPFVASAAGALYAGDEGERRLEVASGRTVAISGSGAEIFDRVPAGNGTISIAPGAGNAGSATHDGGGIADASLLTGHAYRIVFNTAGPATTYDVLDVTLGSTLVAGAAYTSGAAIALDGLQVKFEGAPAGGDRFDILPSARRSVFDTLRSLATQLRTPATGAAGRAALANALTSGLLSLDQAAERVLAARTRMGADLNELDSLAAAVSSDKLGQERQIARLTGLDYAEAAGRFASQQAAIEAAQRSYVRVTGLSLFQYL